ncbi:MAG: hypothetical protein DWI02_08300 [Planctomycetota bacterium]|nr:MAG: hypothetical protein DWI02_08300 [Planctomycetota bacterium]
MGLPGNWAVSVVLRKESLFCGWLLFRWFFRLLSVHVGLVVASIAGFQNFPEFSDWAGFLWCSAVILLMSYSG